MKNPIDEEDIVFTIYEDAERFMLAQRGDLAEYYKDGRDEWLEEWREELYKTLGQIFFEHKWVLDIGSGIGPIDVVLCRRLGSHCTLVDGEDGQPFVKRHNLPFGNRKVTEKFFADNGVHESEWRYLNPEQFTETSKTKAVAFDFVMSLRSWCFHYEPDVYLDQVKRVTLPGSVVMVDVRNGKPTWRQQLEETWPNWQVVESCHKFTRMKFLVEPQELHG